MKKKIFAIALSLLLALTFAIPFALADNGPATFSSETVNGSVGDTVVVPISVSMKLNNNCAIDSIEFNLFYDAEELEFVESSTDGCVMDNGSYDSFLYNLLKTDSGASYFRGAYIGYEGIKESGVMFTISFKIKGSHGSALTLNEVKYSTFDYTAGKQTLYDVDHAIELNGVSVNSNAVPTAVPEALASPQVIPTTNTVITATATPKTTAYSTFTNDGNTTAMETAVIMTPSPTPAGGVTAADTAVPDASSAADDSALPDATSSDGASGIDVSAATDAPSDVTATDAGDDGATTDTPKGGMGWLVYALGGLGIILIVAAVVALIIQKKRK